MPAGQGAWCPAHARASTSRFNRQRADAARGTAAERGYDSRWQRARLAWLARFPLCPGVLIATAHWARDLAEQFHALREQEQWIGRLLVLTAPGPCLEFLAQWPIYRIERWEVERTATVIDHIIPHRGDPDLFWAEWNWQPLTKRAHDKKTAREENKNDVPTLAAGTPNPSTTSK